MDESDSVDKYIQMQMKLKDYGDANLEKDLEDIAVDEVRRRIEGNVSSDDFFKGRDGKYNPRLCCGLLELLKRNNDIGEDCKRINWLERPFFKFKFVAGRMYHRLSKQERGEYFQSLTSFCFYHEKAKSFNERMDDFVKEAKKETFKRVSEEGIIRFVTAVLLLKTGVPEEVIDKLFGEEYKLRKHEWDIANRYSKGLDSGKF